MSLTKNDRIQKISETERDISGLFFQREQLK